MSGRLLMLALLGFTLVFGASLVWFQFFAYYEWVDGRETVDIDGTPVPVAGYTGIDATSSPLKLRACFRIDPAAVADLEPAEGATPLTPPPWFRCFDARTLSADLAAGRATAYRIGTDSPEGFDRYLAVYPDGRAFLWRQLSARFAD